MRAALGDVLAMIDADEGMMHASGRGRSHRSPAHAPRKVLDRIATDRAAGLSLARIADTGTAEGVATAHGAKRCYPSTVRAVLTSLPSV